MAPTFNASSAYPGLADYPHQEHIKDGKLSHSEAHFEDDLAQDGSVDMRGNSVRRSKTGGWKACGFIIVDEISERLAYYGIASNLITYLTTVLHEGTASSARNVNNWVGVTYIVPLAGAFLADTFTGRYWSIAVFSIVYILGLVSLTLSVCIKSLRPPSCANVVGNAACPRANSAQLGVFFFSLYLISVGTGGLKPCLEAFGADQFDEEDPKERRRKSSFFNVWNVGLCMGALTAITALVYIQENVSWGLGFGIPTTAMGVAFLCFLGGTSLYRHKRHGGSPLTRVVQVLVASLRKWRVRVPSDPALLHHRHPNSSSDEESLRFGRRHLQHTASLSFLDKAAVTEPEHEGMAKANPWRLCTVTQVEGRYDAVWGDQRIVDKHFIIKPKVEFEVGKETLGGLLALGYQVAVSYKRESDIFDDGSICICIETVDDLEKTFVLVKGKDRKVVATEASSLGIEGPWITKSYLELVLERKGLPRLGSPPLPMSAFQVPTSPRFLNAADNGIAAPRPLRLKPLIHVKTPDTPEPWTRSPTKSEMESSTAFWRFAPTTEIATGKATAGGTTPMNMVDPTDNPLRARMHFLPIPEAFDFDRGLLLAVQGVQTLVNAKGPPVIVGIGGPSGSGKTSLAYKMANIVGCEVISLENYYKSEQVREFKYDDFTSLDLSLLLKNIQELRAHSVAMVPLFDFEKNVRSAFKAIEVSKECGVVIIEGVYALHPNIRNSLDFWIAVVGGVHSHLIARVQRDLERSSRPLSSQDIMRTVFPMFQQHIEPDLVHAHLKIRNDFDPVHSPDSSMFVLKSSKEVSVKDIAKVLDPERVSTTVQHFTDIYLHLPGSPSNGLFTESNCIRVRNCEGRFALLIREPIREGNFIIQPKVDFDISVRTVSGLLNLGYQAMAYLEATATIYHDEKLLIEVDYLKNMDTPFIQIKGSNKEAVAAAGLALNLEGTYTTMPYIEIVLGNKYARVEGFVGLHDPEAAELRKWIDFVHSQAGSSGSDDIASPTVPMEFLLEELQIRVKRLERWNRWHIFNSALWTFFMSAFVGYVLFQRKRRSA